MDFLGFDNSERLEIELTNIKKSLADLDTRKKWDLIDKETRNVIGNCGFHNWLPEHERAEIGYFLREDCRGKGFMLEALNTILEFGFHQMKLNRIEAFISPDNHPSIYLVERLGFIREGQLRAHYKFGGRIHDSVVYSLLKTDAKASRL